MSGLRVPTSVLAAVMVVQLSAVTAAADDGVPASIASTGDSITRAFNVDWCCVLEDSPQYSWSTGTDPTVASLYLRLLDINPAIRDHSTNLAQTGARMTDLDGQLSAAASAQTDFVTVLMGANDVCATSLDAMTPVDTFQAQYGIALTHFFAADPGGIVYQLSIPNVHRLWEVLHGNPVAQLIWDLFGICRTMLSSDESESDRQLALAREQAYNQVLEAVCVQFPRCIWDGNALFNVDFSAADASTIDYFHPNLAGQNHLAQVAWDTLVGLTAGTAQASRVPGPRFSRT